MIFFTARQMYRQISFIPVLVQSSHCGHWDQPWMFKVLKFSPSKLALAKIKTSNNHEFLTSNHWTNLVKFYQHFLFCLQKIHLVSNLQFFFFFFFLLTTFFQRPEPNELIKCKTWDRKYGTKYFHLSGRNTWLIPVMFLSGISQTQMNWLNVIHGIGNLVQNTFIYLVEIRDLPL